MHKETFIDLFCVLTYNHTHTPCCIHIKAKCDIAPKQNSHNSRHLHLRKNSRIAWISLPQCKKYAGYTAFQEMPTNTCIPPQCIHQITYTTLALHKLWEIGDSLYKHSIHSTLSIHGNLHGMPGLPVCRRRLLHQRV